MASKILLVEDDASFRAVFAVALELQGFVVYQAGSGRGALELLGIEKPDMIISDLEMSGIDGRALCKFARSDSRLSSIPFAILSAFVDPDGSGGIEDLPADCCLSKQDSMSQLVQAIKDLLDRPQPLPQPDRGSPRDRSA
jgi:CheY-like chemotaxis protein